MALYTKILTDAVVSAAKGLSKFVLGELLNSIKGDNKGQIVSFRAEDNENIICFVHGFCGDPAETFDPIPQFIINENQLQGWDILSIGYSTDYIPNFGKGIWAAKPDLNKVADFLRTNLDILFQNYKRVVLIGHSMGGLVIQRAILDLKQHSNLTHVMFYGTPSGGLKKAGYGKWFNNQIADMDDVGAFITQLRTDWNTKFDHKYPFEFYTVAGELDDFVPVESSHTPFPEEFRLFTTGNHVSMVKPDSVHDTSFQIIKGALTSDSKFLAKYNYKALNNLVGVYHETVQTLEKKISLLDKNSFKEYIFALEGTGKIDKALETLKNSSAVQNSSDFMGILGGRYKRKYLIEREQTFIDEAVVWYTNGYNLATKNTNPQQIYYHSINLAFMNLLNDNQNMTVVKDFARIAIENCKKSDNKDHWELATQAEAYLYLNDWKESKDYYGKAIKATEGNIREYSSIMINAIHASTALAKYDIRAELENMFSL